MWLISGIALTFFSCALRRSLCHSWIYWADLLPSPPEGKRTKYNYWQLNEWPCALHAETIISHIWKYLDCSSVLTCWLLYQYSWGPFSTNQKRCHFCAMKTLLSFLFFQSQPSQSGWLKSRQDTRRRLKAVVIPERMKGKEVRSEPDFWGLLGFFHY